MTQSDFCLPRELQGILDLDAEVQDGAFQLGVSQQQLHSPDVLGASVDPGRFGATYWVGAKGCRIETDFLDPRIRNTCVLPGPQVRGVMNATAAIGLPGSMPVRSIARALHRAKTFIHAGIRQVVGTSRRPHPSSQVLKTALVKTR